MDPLTFDIWKTCFIFTVAAAAAAARALFSSGIKEPPTVTPTNYCGVHVYKVEMLSKHFLYLQFLSLDTLTTRNFSNGSSPGSM
jgi:hypothetical protein